VNSGARSFLIIILVGLTVLVIAQSVLGVEDEPQGHDDDPRGVGDGIQVLQIRLSMDDDRITVDPLPGGSGEAVVTGTVETTGAGPNTLVTLSAEIDNGWKADTYPDSIRSGGPHAQASFDFSVTVTVSTYEMAYTEGVLMVTATASSPITSDKMANAAVMVRIGQYHDIDVVWKTKTVECSQNDTFKIKGTITNNGNGHDTVAFIIERPFPGVQYIVDYADAPINETTDFSVTVEVPANASLGKHHLKIHAFTLEFFSVRQISARDIELVVVEEKGTGGGLIALGLIGLGERSSGGSEE
jgi:hypothetical protein